MARKENRSNRWIKSERVGNVTLYLTKRSPFWWMYWIEDGRSGDEPDNGSRRGRERCQSTKETDVGLARLVASQKNDELFRHRRYPGLEKPVQRRDPVGRVVDEFIAYLQGLDRSYDYIRNIKSRLDYLVEWMANVKLEHVQDITSDVLRRFGEHLKGKRSLKASTTNDYMDAIHCFFGFVIFKRRLMPGPNPAATGRQAELDRFRVESAPPPTIYPEQVNAIIETATRHGDRQIVNMVVFICVKGYILDSTPPKQ